MRHISQLRDKMALNKLQENKFLVLEDMELETREGSVKYGMGEEIVLGANKDEDLVVREIDKLYVIEDPEVAKEVVENCVCKEELSDVKYKKFTILEAKDMRITSSNLVKAVADEDEIRAALKDMKKRKEALFEIKQTGVNLPYVEVAKPMDIESKKAKLRENVFTAEDKANYEYVEAVEISESPESAKGCILLDTMKVIGEAAKDHKNVASADDFMNDVKNLEGEVEPAEDKKLVGKKGEVVIGVFDPETSVGVIFPAGQFKDVKELEDAMKDTGINLKDEVDLEKFIQIGKDGEVEAELDAYEKSDKSEECKKKCKQGLCNCGMSDDVADSVIECIG